MFKAIKKSKSLVFIGVLIDLILMIFYIVGKIFFSDVLTFLEWKYTEYIFVSVLTIIPLIISIDTIRKLEFYSRKNYVKIGNTLSTDISEAYTFGEIGILTYNEDNDVIWANDLFFSRNIKIMGTNIPERFPDLNPFFTSNYEDTIIIQIANRKYSVMHIKSLSVLIFKDVTSTENLFQKINEETPVVLTILFDDLNHIVSITHDEAYTQIESVARKEVMDWAKANGILLKRVKDDLYVGLMHEKTYEKIAREHFSIVRTVAKLSNEKDVSYTISLGFGRGINDFVKLNELSAAAIDVAQTRGGNQTVVNNYAGHLEFYGGEGAENKTSKHIIKNRVMAQSFYAHVQAHKTILIVPHTEADFDAIGAALGVYSLAKFSGRQAFIVCEEKQIEMKARLMLKDTLTRDEFADILITQKEALSMLDNTCLVVAVDVNKKSITTAPKLVEAAKDIAVIDHHRKSEDAIDNPMFSHVDSSASSASEMVTEMINDNPVKLTLSEQIATYLLAGILLDTGDFKNRTTSATFRAAMILKEFDADTEKASSYMKDEYEEYVLKTRVLSTMESPYFGIMLGQVPNEEYVDRSTLAKVCSEAVDIKGVKAAFVIGFIENNKVGISARSNGSINVQLIMEKLGGGGHHSAGAAQIPNTTIEKVKKQLLDLLEVYMVDIQQ